jgi:hypothetical protein
MYAYNGKIDGRETEWTLAQRKHGNLPELEEEEKQEEIIYDINDKNFEDYVNFTFYQGK